MVRKMLYIGRLIACAGRCSNQDSIYVGIGIRSMQETRKRGSSLKKRDGLKFKLAAEGRAQRLWDFKECRSDFSDSIECDVDRAA